MFDCEETAPARICYNDGKYVLNERDASMNRFQPQKHICKFFFLKYDHAGTSDYRQKISADLYLNELKLEILDAQDNVVDVFGYSLKDKLNGLLPLLRWEDFEKTREISDWGLGNECGYRDGWGYEFICMNESGKPLIRNYLDMLYKDKDKPAYEKLLTWIIKCYAHKRELKKYALHW